MRESANIKEVATLKPDWIGFIFYPKSKRYVGTDFNPALVQSLMPEIQTVGVFVNEEYEDMITIAKKYNFDMVQLHGNESPEYCNSAHEDGFDVIKAFGVNENIDWSILEQYIGICKYFLFDTSTKDYGGSGKKFDWNTLESYPFATPFILSGGIGPDDADAIKSISIPEFSGIDINSCFEIEPALKDMSLLKPFVSQIRQQ